MLLISFSAVLMVWGILLLFRSHLLVENVLHFQLADASLLNCNWDDSLPSLVVIWIRCCKFCWFSLCCKFPIQLAKWNVLSDINGLTSWLLICECWRLLFRNATWFTLLLLSVLIYSWIFYIFVSISCFWISCCLCNYCHVSLFNFDLLIY